MTKSVAYAILGALMSIISLKHITKTFQLGDTEVRALRDVSLEVAAGEFVAVMGQSGSGKSTLMNIIGLLDRPTSGEYTLDGAPVSLSMSDSAQARLRSEFIGFIFQNFNLLPNIDVMDNVLLPASYFGVRGRDAKARAKELLDMVKLSHRLHHQVTKLSGGERQRVAIARALMNNPKVVLADEPTGNLDSASGDEVLNILRDLNKGGTTMVMVTHNEDLARLAHRTIHMKDGQLV